MFKRFAIVATSALLLGARAEITETTAVKVQDVKVPELKAEDIKVQDVHDVAAVVHETDDDSLMSDIYEEFAVAFGIQQYAAAADCTVNKKCTKCVGYSNCAFCKSANVCQRSDNLDGVCVKQNGKTESRITSKWNCPGHLRWWHVLLIVIAGACCAPLICCLCFFYVIKRFCCGDKEA